MLNFYKTIIISFLAFSSLSLTAAEFSIVIKSTTGQTIEDAVVTLTPIKAKKTKTSKTYIIDQINKTYVPHVKIIPVGSKISFPNKDNIRHHVYSFSNPKKFELPLYEGTPTKPVSFKQAGIVVLGCNIHDWMRGYIYITDTPYYGLSGKSGTITIKNIPKGQYFLRIWHPRIKDYSEQKAVKIKLTKNKIRYPEVSLQLKPKFKIRRAPKAKRRRY